jgi:rare lipoprotein A (peptidoglycan hydrolase)
MTVKVTYLGPGAGARTPVEVRIIDHGPYVKDPQRNLDLSRAAFRKLTGKDYGKVPVLIEIELPVQ